MPTDLRVEKQRLREVMKARRAEAKSGNPEAGARLRNNFLKNVALSSDAIIASYIAAGNEIDPSLLTEALSQAGHPLALPVVTGNGQALLFRQFKLGDQLSLGAFGIPEPLMSAPVQEPDIILVPMLAFDRQRYRLGYGGGYYDRTISLLRCIKPLQACGLAYDAQEVPEVPCGTHDEQLDKIITETHVF